MKKFVVGLMIGVLLMPVAAMLYVWFGYAPVATAAPPLPLERTLTRIALNARIKKEAPKDSPVQPTDANLVAGAKLYREYCAVCHGTAGEKTATAAGMFPPPPQLLRGRGVTNDPVGETYWKAANGIRLTGMPAYRGSLNDDELWQVSEFLANMNKAPASVKQVMTQPAPAH